MPICKSSHLKSNVIMTLSTKLILMHNGGLLERNGTICFYMICVGLQLPSTCCLVRGVVLLVRSLKDLHSNLSIIIPQRGWTSLLLEILYPITKRENLKQMEGTLITCKENTTSPMLIWWILKARMVTCKRPMPKRVAARHTMGIETAAK